MLVEQTDDLTVLASAAGGFKAAGILGHGGACYLTGVMLVNASDDEIFVKLYDKLTAGLNTDTPAIRLAIPGNSATGGQVLSFRCKILFTLGLSIRVTTVGTDEDETAPGNFECMGMLTFAPTKLA